MIIPIDLNVFSTAQLVLNFSPECVLLKKKQKKKTQEDSYENEIGGNVGLFMARKCTNQGSEHCFECHYYQVGMPIGFYFRKENLLLSLNLVSENMVPPVHGLSLLGREQCWLYVPHSKTIQAL